MNSETKILSSAVKAMIILVTGILSACGGGGGGSLESVAAIVTAPITMPIMIFEARRNDREAFLDQARENLRPLPPLDPESRKMADDTLLLALDRGQIDKGYYWENNQDRNGRRAGGVTVLSTEHLASESVCREVLIETVIEGQPTDKRVRTWCRHGMEPWKEPG